MVQTVEQEERAREYAGFIARKKFKSNGDQYSPNEKKLFGQIGVSVETLRGNYSRNRYCGNVETTP